MPQPFPQGLIAAFLLRYHDESGAKIKQEVNGMKYYAVFLPMADQEKSERFRPQHLSFLETMRKEGHVYANGKFTDGSGGLVIYRAASVEECESRVKQDPYIEHGARNYEIHEWEAVWAE
jgi:uncharacterized protein YciI